MGFVRRLVVYGTRLLTTLQQNASTPRQGASVQRDAWTMYAFGTKDLALIIERIKCGLLRAAGLQARLNSFVERGRDLRPAPFRMSMPRAPKEAADAVPEAAALRAVARAELLSRLPSAEEIAEQVRSRSIGVVIADICRDLGLPPGMMDGVMWQELSVAFLDCGFSLGGFLQGRRWPPPLGEEYSEVDFSLCPWVALADEGMAAAAGQPP